MFKNTFQVNQLACCYAHSVLQDLICSGSSQQTVFLTLKSLESSKNINLKMRRICSRKEGVIPPVTCRGWAWSQLPPFSYHSSSHASLSPLSHDSHLVLSLHHAPSLVISPSRITSPNSHQSQPLHHPLLAPCLPFTFTFVVCLNNSNIAHVS